MSPKTEKGIVAVDLFCGIGGLTKGLTKAGIPVIKGYDIDSDLKITYEKNNPDTKFYSEDVRNLSKKELLKGLSLKKNYLLLAGCAPCQPFSKINKKSRKNDGRVDLILELARIIRQTTPDFLFIENVPG